MHFVQKNCIVTLNLQSSFFNLQFRLVRAGLLKLDLKLQAGYLVPFSYLYLTDLVQDFERIICSI
ncbi:hypothetical protein D1BOALGB6SA_7179 [Olavius sp. associated proteobacterium Delta 1]|nr:hypothetical protein D1BOALGB6SA_7179 [Olavius sp. associated proteobacterium Delta 1]